jgi:hypothetical protein
MSKDVTGIRMTRRSFTTYGLATGLSLAAPSIAAAATKVDAKVPFLRGVNFVGLSDESWSQPPAKPAVDYYIRQKKMNVVRLVTPWEFIQPDLKAPLDAKSVALMQDQVDRVTGAGASSSWNFTKAAAASAMARTT